MSRRRSAAALRPVTVLLALSRGAAVADGDLDPLFGASGVALASTALGDAPRALVADASGRLVAVGDAIGGPSSSAFLVARFTEEGLPDTTFDGDGLRAVGISWGGASNNHATAVAIQPDGRIVVAGYAVDASGDSNAGMLVRLLPDGTPDPTFDGDGIVVLAVAGQNHAFHAVVPHPGGDILVAGAFDDTVVDQQIELVQFSSTGVLGGFVSFDLFATLPDRLGGFFREPDGRLVLVAFASTSSEVVVTRRLSDGSPDDTFAGDGVGHYPQAAAVTGVDIDRVEDGRYVIGVDFDGSASFDWLLRGGGVDTTACAELPFCILLGFDVADLVAQTDGRMIAIGTNTATGDPRAFRLLEAGSVDPEFGDSGSREFDCLPGAPSSVDSGRAVALAGGRAAALAWRSGDAASDSYCLARLTSATIFGGGFEGGDLWGWSTVAP